MVREEARARRVEEKDRIYTCSTLLIGPVPMYDYVLGMLCT